MYNIKNVDTVSNEYYYYHRYIHMNTHKHSHHNFEGETNGFIPDYNSFTHFLFYPKNLLSKTQYLHVSEQTEVVE